MDKLTALRREYGEENDPFEIMLALLGAPSPDLFKRAEDIGVTAVMCSPWARAEDLQAGNHDSFKHPGERYRAAIERFAETVIEKCR